MHSGCPPTGSVGQHELHWGRHPKLSHHEGWALLCAGQGWCGPDGHSKRTKASIFLTEYFKTEPEQLYSILVLWVDQRWTSSHNSPFLVSSSGRAVPYHSSILLRAVLNRHCLLPQHSAPGPSVLPPDGFTRAPQQRKQVGFQSHVH